MFNLRGPVHFFVFDPHRPRVLYAGNNNLWRSSDDGKTWKLLWPAAADIQEIRMASDHADEAVISRGSLQGAMRAFAVDPADSRHLFAALSGSQPQLPGGSEPRSPAASRPQLIDSNDGGAHWRRLSVLPENAEQMWISAQPHPSLLIAGSHRMVEGWGHTFQTFALPAETVAVSAGRQASGQWALYAAGGSHLALSSDSGASWKPTPLPGTGAEMRAVATSLLHPEIAYVSYANLRLGHGKWHGVARTRDSGRSWQLVWQEANVAAGNVEDAWLTERFGTEWGENPLNLAAADEDATS